ncbi:hypothetical protein [Nitrosomonas sp.]|uniref:hypothetical protein n=1 Tax=Nitrosomonas sp. TaxID=42353 RepID=UPI0037C8D01A
MKKTVQHAYFPFSFTFRHLLPFVVMATGAGALFLTTFLLRLYANPETFSAWSYLVTYITFFFSFALLGAEQLIIRCAEVTSSGHIRITRATAYFLMLGAGTFLVVALVVLNGQLFDYKIHPINLIFLLLAIMGLLILYQTNRLSGAHIIGQTAMNLWRLVLLLAISGALLFDLPLQIEVLLTIVMTFSALIGLVISPNVAQVRLITTCRPEGALFSAFAVSLLTMAILGIFDRLVLENVPFYNGLGFEDYFYLMTLVVFPFNLLGSYIGYVAARQFRDTLLPRQFFVFTLLILVGTGIAAMLWSGLLVFVIGSEQIGLPDVSVLVWGLIILLIEIKTAYALLSSATAVRASAKALFLANGFTIIVIIIAGISSYYWVTSTEQVILAFITVWASRYFSFIWTLKNQWGAKISAI